jgi:glycosyltransferase involved in cell wall biosynthesis
MPEPIATPPYRLAILTSHVVQYQAPLWRRLAATPEVSPHVMFCSSHGAETYLDRGFGRPVKWDIPLLDGYSHEILPNLSRWSQRGGFWSAINPGIIARLRTGRFDAVLVHGWMRCTFWLAMLTAFALGLPVIMRGESNLLAPGPRGRTMLKRVGLPIFFRRIRAFLAIGRHNAEFYRAHGVPEERIFLAPYAVDNDYFTGQAASLPDRSRLKHDLGLPDAPVVLFCGKLSDVKRPLDLLQAFERVVHRYPASLVYVGDGPLSERLRRYASDRDVPNVRILGFRNQSELARCYGAADVFVLPSGFEPWGLVVNEAMCFALPVVVSGRVGAGGDLVQDGVNGSVFPAGDIAALARALEHLLAMTAESRARIGEASREIIGRWGNREVVAGIVRCLETVVGGRHATSARFVPAR